MGFLDALFGGKRKLEGPAAQDRIFAMTTAYITLETSFGLKHRNQAGIVFQSLATADFAQVVRDTEELLRGAAADTGTTVETKTDDFGYSWIVLSDPDFEDVVTAVNVVSTELTAGGYGDRILAAVFSFEENGKPVYFIYNFKRGKYYPFVPAPGTQARNNEREFQLKAQMDGELPFEPELERWFPLWDIPL
ncbi:MAG: hypothetical protein QOJ07_3167 [Thermoleophilaceae bacterium]|jgi:hypothetical protein|nr:hypothetical protein [Thermoleophilaceae bacterium]